MKILVDMNLSPRWFAFLNAAGIDATHWSSAGAANASDTEIMTFAKENDYVVMTHDLNFSAILASNHGQKPSVVQLRSEDVSPAKIGTQVVLCRRRGPSWSVVHWLRLIRFACACGFCLYRNEKILIHLGDDP